MNRLFVPLFLVLQACSGQSAKDTAGIKTAKPTIKKVYKALDTTLKMGGYEVRIQSPADSVKGDLLLLPGWDYNNRKWCDSSDVCRTALAKGFRVVAPQMSRSIYAKHYFPETRADMAKHPTLTWLDSSLDLLSQKFGCFKSGKNYVLGLSTGGRGVVLICEAKPGFFHAAAALSGDFDQSKMPADNLSILVYGPYARFTKRWQTADNPVFLVNSMKTPIYLGHGLRDRVVPSSQTQLFADALKIKKPDLPVILHLDAKAGHNFSYWRSELPAVWQFFERF